MYAYQGVRNAFSGHLFVSTKWMIIPYVGLTQLTFTCSKSTIETLEKSVKYVQS